MVRTSSMVSYRILGGTIRYHGWCYHDSAITITYCMGVFGGPREEGWRCHTMEDNKMAESEKRSRVSRHRLKDKNLRRCDSEVRLGGSPSTYPVPAVYDAECLMTTATVSAKAADGRQECGAELFGGPRMTPRRTGRGPVSVASFQLIAPDLWRPGHESQAD